MTVLIELHYLPSIAYWCALQHADEILIERHEYFVKQSYRNRCHINAAHGRETLVVPLTAKHGKVVITDVRIDYGQKWLNNHWRTIQSAYGKAPYFEYYADDLHAVLFAKETFLYDLNFKLLSMCLKWMRWQKAVKETLSYENVNGILIDDRRSLINAKKSGSLEKFYKPVPYQQVFGNTFAENVSLVDLIFCKGPEAVRIIEASSRDEQIRF